MFCAVPCCASNGFAKLLCGCCGLRGTIVNWPRGNTSTGAMNK